MGSFNRAEFRSWHSTCSFTELQIIAMGKGWKGQRVYSPTLPFWTKVMLTTSKTLQIVWTVFKSLLYRQFHISTDKSFQNIHPDLLICYFYYCNLSLSPCIHFALNRKKNVLIKYKVEGSTLYLIPGISRHLSAIFTPHLSHYGTGHVS